MHFCFLDNSSRSLDKVHMFDQSEDGKLFSNRHSKNTDEEKNTHQVRPGLPYIQVCFCPNADLLDEKFKINLSISNRIF